VREWSSVVVGFGVKWLGRCVVLIGVHAMALAEPVCFVVLGKHVTRAAISPCEKGGQW
jgi:hypothetical protein